MKKLVKSILSIVLIVSLLIPTGSLMFTVNAENSSIKVGDTITLGTYPQSAIKDTEGNITGYKEEPIEWIVLNITDGKALLLSKKIIDGKAYNSTSATVNGYYGNNYAHSDIRKWLIEDFYNTAFSNSDKNTIIPTILDNSAESSKYSSESTTDNVFLLSKWEAESYAHNYYSTTATDYAYSNGFVARTSTEPCNQWRLRTARSNYYEIYKVEIRWGKWTVYYNWYDDEISSINGIRPAFYLDIEKYEYDIKGNGIKLYSTHSSNYLSVGNTVDIIVGNYKDNVLDTSAQDFVTVISDSDVIDVTKGNWNNNKGRCYSITAKKQGTSTITFSIPGSNKSTAFTFYVENKETAYTFYNLPKLTYEEGKTTHFYNYGGLVVDDFTYSAHKNGDKIDYYDVNMTIYNKCNLYGAVTSFDKYGNIYEYNIIDKFSDMDSSFTSSLKSLFYETGDLCYLLCNEYYYSGKSITTTNKIEIRVPVGGYIQISNNIAESEVAFTANSVYGILGLMSVAKEYAELFDLDKFNEAQTKAIVNTVTGRIIDKTINKSLKKAAITSIQNIKMNYNNIDEFFIELGNKTDEIMNFNLVEEIEKNICSVSGVANIAESYITALLPTGGIIKVLYASNSALDYALFNNEYSLSPNKPTGINIYAPSNSNSYVSSGIEISPTNGNIQSDITTHSYIVEDIDLSQVNNSSWVNTNDFVHYKQQMYNITLYKNGNESQPDSTVMVKIPLPTGFRTTALKVYRYNNDGSLVDMNAYVNDGYIIFETNHFSYYLILDETVEHTDTNHDGICDICQYDFTNNCSHICHSENSVLKLIWKILSIIFKFFGLDEYHYCDCGMAHW